LFPHSFPKAERTATHSDTSVKIQQNITSALICRQTFLPISNIFVPVSQNGAVLIAGLADLKRAASQRNAARPVSWPSLDDETTLTLFPTASFSSSFRMLISA